MRLGSAALTAAAAIAIIAAIWGQGRGNPTDWPTANGDAQRSSWMRSDPNISLETMREPGFGLQWEVTLESPARQGLSLSQGVVTPAVNLFTPISTIAGPENLIFAVDNDTGNVFWTRRFDGSLAGGTVPCPGGITGAPTRTVNVLIPLAAPARGGAARGGRAYSGAVGEPGAGVPIPQTAGGRGGGGGAGRGQAAPPVPAPASPFPTNPAAVAAAGGGRSNLFRSSGVIYAVSADGMLRTLGVVSGKEVRRPRPFLPAGARFSDLIAVDDMVYATTSQGCSGAPRAVWAVNTEGDTASVVSWQTNGGDPLGPVAFTTTGTLIAAVGAGAVRSGGYANAIVALDPKTLELKDWFRQPGIEFAAAPVVLEQDGRNVVAVTTRDGRVVLLDGSSLGGANHATALFVSQPLIGGRGSSSGQSPATWQEPDGTRWLVVPTTDTILAVRVSRQNKTLAVHPGWVSEDIRSPLTPIVVNGVVFAAAPNSPTKLYALNGTTGSTLWRSDDAMRSPMSGRSFWAGSGHVFVGTRDGTVYAFGFDMERGSMSQRKGS
jgi:outer membrane protein assembly factor BamB